jgi:hypothetical protein
MSSFGEIFLAYPGKRIKEELESGKDYYGLEGQVLREPLEPWAKHGGHISARCRSPTPSGANGAVQGRRGWGCRRGEPRTTDSLQGQTGGH